MRLQIGISLKDYFLNKDIKIHLPEYRNEMEMKLCYNSEN